MPMALLRTQGQVVAPMEVLGKAIHSLRHNNHSSDLPLPPGAAKQTVNGYDQEAESVQGLIAAVTVFHRATDVNDGDRR